MHVVPAAASQAVHDHRYSQNYVHCKFHGRPSLNSVGKPLGILAIIYRLVKANELTGRPQHLALGLRSPAFLTLSMPASRLFGSANRVFFQSPYLANG